jgi:hypothetical protein
MEMRTLSVPKSTPATTLTDWFSLRLPLRFSARDEIAAFAF